MIQQQFSPTALLPEMLRRLAGSIQSPEQRDTLRSAAERIRYLERRCGIRSHHKIARITRETNEIGGQLLTLKEAVELYGADGVTYNTASSRYHGRGWPLIEAIATPVLCKSGGIHGRRIKRLTLRSEREKAA